MSLESNFKELLTDRVAKGDLAVRRYEVIPPIRTKFWWLTFWKKKWHAIKIIEVLPNDPGYDKAPYETHMIFN